MVEFRHRGNFNKTEKFLTRIKDEGYLNILERYGQMGVDALKTNTPIDSGKTANSWSFEISHGRDGTSLSWINTNENDGVNIAIILQFGHGTGTGGYVKGVDYINPAIQPIFDKIAEEVWKEVTSA